MIAQASETLLQSLPNGGAVVAVVVVVVLFLKRIEKSEETLKGIVEAFAADSSASRAEYRAHVGEVMNMGLAAHAETRAAIRSLDATLSGLKDAGGPREDPR